LEDRRHVWGEWPRQKRSTSDRIDVLNTTVAVVAAAVVGDDIVFVAAPAAAVVVVVVVADDHIVLVFAVVVVVAVEGPDGTRALGVAPLPLPLSASLVGLDVAPAGALEEIDNAEEDDRALEYMGGSLLDLGRADVGAEVDSAGKAGVEVGKTLHVTLAAAKFCRRIWPSGLYRRRKFVCLRTALNVPWCDGSGGCVRRWYCAGSKLGRWVMMMVIGGPDVV
jgi:hypothetical protein